MLESKNIHFTKEQHSQIKQFQTELSEGNVDFVFTGDILEGITFLEGISKIVDAVNY